MTTPIENAARTTQSILGLLAKAKQPAAVTTFEEIVSEVSDPHQTPQVLHETNQNVQNSRKRSVALSLK